MNDTRLLHQTLVLTDDPDAIKCQTQDGYTFIVLGTTSIAVSTSGQAALDKFATAVAQAAADQRAHTLKAVS